MKKIIFWMAAMMALVCSCKAQDNYIAITGLAQGSNYLIKINISGAPEHMKSEPELIKKDIDSLLNVIDFTLSGYNKGSLLSKFNEGERIVPNEIFIDIYNISYKFYELSEGAFDTAAGPLFDAWGFGFKTQEFPSEEAVQQILGSCGMGRLVSDMRSVLAPDGSIAAVDLLKVSSGAAPRLNYNAIAQGYSCDLVRDYLYNIGVKDMLVMIGGEIYCEGVNPSGVAWTIGVDKPVDGNDQPGEMLEGMVTSEGKPCGIVTSGNYRKFYIKDGRKYAHSVDPRTGYPVSHNLLSATITAADATSADALATYCMVLGLEEAQKFILAHPEYEAYFIYDAGEENLGTWSSKE